MLFLKYMTLSAHFPLRFIAQERIVKHWAFFFFSVPLLKGLPAGSEALPADLEAHLACSKALPAYLEDLPTSLDAFLLCLEALPAVSKTQP